MIELISLFLIVSILFVFSCFFVFPILFGAPFDVTRKQALKNIIKLTNPKKGDKIAELGSGDGRICIALAQKNKQAKIHGFEINPFLVWISKRKIKKLKLENQIKIHWKNFWKINLEPFNKIIFFQYFTITKQLQNKFEKELKPKTKIISHNWKLPNLKPKKILGKKALSQGEVYLYEI